jgi:hypothetical protein
MVCALRSCVFVQIAVSQAKVKRLSTSLLPESEKLVLLEEATEVGGGSDDRCYTALLSRLYGSDQSAEDILAFFQDIFLPRSEWMQVETGCDSRKCTFLNREDGFGLVIDCGIESFATPGFTSFSEQSLAQAQQQFVTSCEVVVRHAVRSVRENCWAGWEP